MSLIGQKSALISVGVSCQTVHQVERAIDLAREIDPTIEKKGLPFDWLICPPLSAAGMLDDDELFPSVVEELKPLSLEVARPDGALTIPGWPRRNAFFWHEFRATDATWAAQFPTMRQKFDHMRESFIALRSREVVAVVSNTQANFAMIERVTGVGRAVRASEMNRLKSALDRALQQPVSLCLVADEPTFILDAEPRFRVFPVTQTSTDWTGDELAWRPVIRQVLRSQR